MSKSPFLQIIHLIFLLHISFLHGVYAALFTDEYICNVTMVFKKKAKPSKLKQKQSALKKLYDAS